MNVMQFDVGGGPGLKVQATHVPVVGSTGFDSPPPSTGQTAVFTHCPFWGPKPDGHVGCASHRPVPKLNVVPVGQLGPCPAGGKAALTDLGDNIGCVFIAAAIRNIAMKIALTVNTPKH